MRRYGRQMVQLPGGQPTLIVLFVQTSAERRPELHSGRPGRSQRASERADRPSINLPSLKSSTPFRSQSASQGPLTGTGRVLMGKYQFSNLRDGVGNL